VVSDRKTLDSEAFLFIRNDVRPNGGYYKLPFKFREKQHPGEASAAL
jgi:hypothetical protein